MGIKTKIEIIDSKLKELYPDTHSFLNYKTDWQLLFAIILSAQATDKSVNDATERLFSILPSIKDYTEENRPIVFDCVKKIGLGKSKTEYLIKTAKILNEKYDGKVPLNRDEIIALPGVAYKTSGVFLAEFYHQPYIPVDTHVQRVSIRLGLVKKDNTPEKTEARLEKLFGKDADIQTHHRLILFGRNICDSRKPRCETCPFYDLCIYNGKKCI